MVKTNASVYTYSHIVQAGDGISTVEFLTGTDLVGNLVVSNPTSGATFFVQNRLPEFISTPVTSVDILLTATDAAGALTSDTFQLCVDGYPTGIPDVETAYSQINLYPNPTKEEVTVDTGHSDHGNVQLTVFSIAGRQIFNRKYGVEESITFDMSGQVSGVYLVKLDFGDRQAIKRLAVDRR